MKNSDSRTRNYATVVYPDSAPENWMEILDQYHVAALISPLHDQDENPDKTQKKPHYHVMLMFEGKKTFETQVKPIFDKIGAVGREQINSIRGYARYMCHLDNPEKAQYKPEDVIAMGGADYDAIIHIATDDIKTLRDMLHYITVNQITSFKEFVDLCSTNNESWFALLASSKSYFIKEYIKSFEWELKKEGPKNYLYMLKKMIMEEEE